MGFGYLKFQILTAEDGTPISKAQISVYYPDGKLIYKTTTDANGNTQKYRLYSPNIENTLTPYAKGPIVSLYNASIQADGFLKLNLKDIPIFDTETTIMTENLLPKVKEPGSATETTVIIPPSPISMIDEYEEMTNQEAIVVKDNKPIINETDVQSYVVDNNLTIPEYITVHLGIPSNSSVQNVRVKFVNYVANVVSGEIYPTWPQNSLEANMHAVVSFALNRIYTRWYRSRGYDFDITNSPAYDMIYRIDGPTFENIGILANRLFNVYARRQGFQDPFFTQFCDGIKAQCNGMTQWGTVELANKGYTPLEILRYYYRPDMQLVLSNNIGSIPDPYPGFPLRIGSTSESVRTMQNYLNRIRVNFPLVPRIENPNGVFGSDTELAVRVFQTAFNMISDGIIGRDTWNKISFVYVAVTKIADLESEGIRIGIGEKPPKVVLRKGDRGPDVLELQFLLNFISVYYTVIPTVIQDSIFDPRTETSVKEFQKTFRLTADGVVGPATWDKLYTVYKSIESETKPPSIIAPPYPGTPLRIGSSGSDVKLMQSYLNTINAVYNLYPLLVADGKFGQNTYNAVVAFQRATNLTPDGVIGQKTWDMIVGYYLLVMGETSIPLKYPGTPLKVGSVGLNVLLMQNYLTALSRKYPSLPVLVPDGKFGRNTEVAVRAFQSLFGLKVDGIIGEQTWYKIIQEYNNM